MKNLILVLVLLISALSVNCQPNYLEDSKEEMVQGMIWFDDAKYGMFIHFGLYSQLGGIYEGNDHGRYAEWIQN